MSGPKNVLLQQLEEHPFHIMLELFFALALAYVLLQRRRKPGKAKVAVVEMPSLEEQERRIAAFHSTPFRAECKSTSMAMVPSLKGIHDVQGRNGCHVTVAGNTLREPTVCLDLGTYDFHSLSTNPDIVDVARKTVMAYGVGSCGPRGFYGTMKPHLDFEKDLAKFCGTEDAVVYSFSYATVSTLISCFASRGDNLICDSGVNSSVEEGCLLSRAKVTHYNHEDMTDLERHMQAILTNENPEKPSRRFVVTEGVFRNSGDICNLPKILELCHSYKFRLILEDSYGFGAIGRTGRGTPEHYGHNISDVDIYVGSMNTALGGVGGFCTGDAAMVDHQRLGATAYVFSASLPPYVMACCSKALVLLDRNTEHVAKLNSHSQTVRQMLRDAKLNQAKIALVDADKDASPLVVLQVANAYITGHEPLDVQDALQRVVNAAEQKGVIILRHVYTTDEPNQNKPALIFALKSEVSDDELRSATETIIGIVKAEFP